MNTNQKPNAREKIMNTAWQLFLTQGYEETTIHQIIEESGTSRSAFYHHFHGKEELLFSLSYTYDHNYDEWLTQCDPALHTVDKLIAFNEFVLKTVEDSPYRFLYPALYGLQVTTPGVRHILNPDRHYYRILRQLLKDGLERGEIHSTHSYAELAEFISSFQIGITYSWCLQQERYSLLQYGQTLLNPFLETLR